MVNQITKIAGISGGVILSVVLFYLFITANGFSFYNEGMSLTYFSDYNLKQELQEDYMQGVEIVTLNDDELKEVPKIKELIDKATEKEFPKNRAGRVITDLETLFEYHRYYATILSEKYSKPPEDFVHILPARKGDLEIHPDAYRYRFDSSYFEYNGIQYGWADSRFTVYGKDNRTDIEVYKTRHTLDPERHTWATITDEDFKQMPLLKQALDNIGTVQENIEVQNSMSGAEVDRYQDWYNKNISSGIFEYDGKYFRLGWWIA